FTVAPIQSHLQLHQTGLAQWANRIGLKRPRAEINDPKLSTKSHPDLSAGNPFRRDALDTNRTKGRTIIPSPECAHQSLGPNPGYLKSKIVPLGLMQYHFIFHVRFAPRSGARIALAATENQPALGSPWRRDRQGWRRSSGGLGRRP